MVPLPISVSSEGAMPVPMPRCIRRPLAVSAAIDQHTQMSHNLLPQFVGLAATLGATKNRRSVVSGRLIQWQQAEP